MPGTIRETTLLLGRFLFCLTFLLETGSVSLAAESRAPNNCLPSKSPIRIMPLGDSITESSRGYVSYRYWLWKALKEDGFNIDFVGSKRGVYVGKPKFKDFDDEHEGHWGWRVDQILKEIPRWATTHKPDFALIHLGTNDIGQGESIDQVIVEIKELILKLREANSKIVVFLAKVLPMLELDEQIVAFNKQIAELPKSMLEPANIVVVDMWSGFDTAKDTWDGLHPNESGERKMAKAWYAALLPTLNQSRMCKN